MLQKLGDKFDGGSNGGGAADPFSQYNVRWMINAALLHRWPILAVPAVVMALASLFVMMRPATYLASTQLELTNLRLTFSREDAFFVETQTDPAFLETQLQVIRSDRVALSALTTLGVVSPESTVTERAEALETFRVRYSVDRAGQSNVVQINYQAATPELAASVANAIATSYISELEAARLASAQSGTSWLRERLREVGPKARVIAEALPPHHKNNLRGIIIILAAGVIGGGLAVVGAIAWQIITGRIQTPEEVEDVTGVSCLGLFPRLPATTARPTKGPIWHTFTVRCPLQTYVMKNPGSIAWHALRNAASACNDCFGGKGLRFIGITSTFKGEGRSTVAANLALSLAASGKNVLLVDADSFDPSFSTLYAGTQPGLVDYLRDGTEPLTKFTIVERHSKLNLLPIGGNRKEPVADIWTDGMQRFIQEAEAIYDYVIFDLPTLGMNADLRAAARYVEGFLLVVGWQQVSSQNIRVGLESMTPIHDKLVGAILNKVDLAKARWTLSAQMAFSSNQLALTGQQQPVDRIGSAKDATARLASSSKNWFQLNLPQMPQLSQIPRLQRKLPAPQSAHPVAVSTDKGAA